MEGYGITRGRLSRYRLFWTKNIYDRQGAEQMFFSAVRENCAYHYRHCREYRKILKRSGFRPGQLESSRDIGRIPVLPTLFFKHHDIHSIAPECTWLKTTSSGTSGTASQVNFDGGALLCGLGMVARTVSKRGLLSLRPARYVIFGYEPHRDNRTAVARSTFGATFFAPPLSRDYALIYRQGQYIPDLEHVMDRLCRYSHGAVPVRILGFPSYAYFVLKQMEERGIHLTLPGGSKMILSGGWKQFEGQKVNKEVLYGLARRVLGIEDKDVAEFFSAAEHPVLYCDCRNHHFHVPVYSQVIIRDIKTMEPLGYGRPGLVNLITPMIKAVPVLSVMTDDVGVLHVGKECGCGIDAPYLELLGRAGVSGIKTCAAGAQDILNGTYGKEAAR